MSVLPDPVPPPAGPSILSQAIILRPQAIHSFCFLSSGDSQCFYRNPSASVTSDGPRLPVTQPHPTQEPLPPQPNTLGYSLGLPHPRTQMCKSEVMP